MAKREFLMLAHPYKPEKCHITGWMMSRKLDGVRAFWDGGVSRGVPAKDIPWANVEKDARYRRPPVATGLWSRYGNVIHAPDYWLDELPLFPLDGELYMGPQMFQSTVSAVKDIVPGLAWKDVQYAIIDTPSVEKVFADGEINNTNYKKKLNGCVDWAMSRLNQDAQPPPSIFLGFDYTYLWLSKNVGNSTCFVLTQEKLPSSTAAAEARLAEFLDEVLAEGGEGVILRKPVSSWLPERSHNLLKFKPWNDAEGTVVGYTWGRETELGSKLLGLMGNLVLNYNGKRLELSGFTNAEREMTFYPKPGTDEVNASLASREPYTFAGQSVSEDWYNPKFPIGTVVSFRYRELTNDGVPKEARYFRRRPANV